jgi:hypothetical protein
VQHRFVGVALSCCWVVIPSMLLLHCYGNLEMKLENFEGTFERDEILKT